ncbi:hemolysin [Fusobacterium polymorphum]|uniref:hemolysin n=1 Tax=Fusobacterium nucleatum subsp. polymorphum TaxID=76857 RepID=UPI000BFDCFC7|nr:hemolysin [Fusobacterium polymorphum]PHI03604.1 hemolysin [Fusobacterium polymorphum]
MEELSRQFKAGEIDEKQLKEAVRELAKGYGKDIGIEYEVVYLDEATMPEDAKGSTGSAYILDEKNRKVLIPIDVKKIKDTGDLFGTIAEEVSHGKDALEGRQDKKVAEDKGNKEKGLESLGRPANDYVKNKLGDDNNSNISLTTDGIDLTNADVGEKVGDVNTQDDRNGGYAEILPSQQKDPWLNKIHFKLLRLRKNTDEFSEKVLITSFYINTKISSMLFDPEDKTIREFTLGALKAGGEDLSLNTYKIPKRFQYNTLPYKYGELFGHSTMSALGILGNITGSGMEGGGTAAALPTGGGSLGVVALGVGVQTYSVGVTATSAINSAKVSYEIKAMKNGGSSSESNSTEVSDDSKKEKKVEKDKIKTYYETKNGKPKVKKYFEKGETLEQHYEKYAIENVEARGINVGRSKEHSNTTLGHWEKAIDIADEAKADPNVEAVYVDETLENISPEIFKKDNNRPDVTIKYKDGTFKLIEVQSKTDYRPKLENKLKNLQTKYGEDVITNYKVEKPKGGK